MNAGWAPSDYPDLDLFSNKHSASHLGWPEPPFALFQPQQLLIGLFSQADETCFRVKGEPVNELGRKEGVGYWRLEKSLLMILRFNYFCKYRRLGLLGDPVSRFFITRVVVRCLGPASRLADVPLAAMRE